MVRLFRLLVGTINSMSESTNEYLAALTELAGVALVHESVEEAQIAICRIAARVVPGGEAASLTTQRDGVPTAIGSDAWARSLDELQYVEHEGPCFDALRTGNSFRIDDFASEVRWPAYAPRAVGAGARSAMSIPASADGKVIGALNVYSREARAFDAEAVSVGQILAGHAGLAAQVTSALYGHRRLAEQLREAMQHRAVIEQAKGMIMLRDRCDADTAFNTLVTASQKSNTKLRLVSQLVVDWGMTRQGDGAEPLAELG